MLRFGYKLMSEEHGPRALVENARRAEQLGFDFVAISDHFFPWLEAQGHSPFAWSVLGAIASQTERIGIATAVTCPTFRYHPAIVAQAAATLAVLAEGRFTLGLGSGELLNEHVVAPRWPSIGVRHEMLREAIEIIRKLFDGELHSFRGEHFELEEARLYDVPGEPPAILVAAGGRQAATLAAESGDGLIATQPDAQLVRAYRDAGGAGPCYAEASLCYAADEEQAEKTLLETHRFGVLDWNVLPELPGPESFEAATRTARAEDLTDSTPVGPDVERHVESLRKYVEAGFDHVVVTPIGPDQDAFFGFWESELRPRLDRLREERKGAASRKPS
jgi:G6PDH family F420-dependent oxidoreductase